MLKIIAKEPAVRTIQVYNNIGIKLLDKKSNDVLISYAANGLATGLYFISIPQNNTVEKILKFTVY